MSLAALLTGALASEGTLAADVTTQAELDAAVSAASNPINIVSGSLALSSAQAFVATTALTVAAGASLSLSSADQTIGSLSGGGGVTLGLTALTTGGDNASTAFSGTVAMTNESYAANSGSLVKIGTGTLTIDNATLQLGAAYILGGAMAQTSGTTAVTYLAVGEGKTGGVANVGALNVSGGTITFGTNLQVGDFGGDGTVNQTGGSLRIIAQCDDAPHCAAVNIGNQGGTGTYNISGGELLLVQRQNSLGRTSGTGKPASSGTLNISGSGVVDISNNGSLIMGYGNPLAAQASSQGTINQTGGVLRIHDGSNLYLSGYNTSSGIYNLNGGAIEAAGDAIQVNYTSGQPGHYQFNLGGGTIKVIETAFTTSIDATLIAGSLSTIDTNGLSAIWGGVLSGAGGLIKTGAGALLLPGINSYTGGTFFNGGTVQVDNDGRLGDATGGLTFDGGTLQYLAGFANSRAVTLNAGGGSFDSNGNNATLSGNIVGIGGLTKIGAGVLTLSGASSYAGATAVNAGTLQAGGSSAFASASAFTVASGATLDLDGFSNVIGSLAGAGDVTLGTATLTSGGDGTSTAFSGVVSGSGGLTKTGAGTLSLTGSNSYAGPTEIDGGILRVNGSLASAVSVNAGGTLMGNSSIVGLAVGSDGVVAPGNSIGTINVAGNVTFTVGSTYLVETDAAGKSDLIVASGTATLAGGTVQLTGSLARNLTYTILTAAGGVSGTFSNLVSTARSIFLSPTLAYTATSVLVKVQQTVSLASLAATANQAAAAAGLDSVPGSNGLIEAVLELGTASAAQKAFDQISGEIHATAQSIMIDDALQVRQAVLGRLRQMPYASASDAMAAFASAGPMLVSAAPTDVAWWAQSSAALGGDRRHQQCSGCDPAPRRLFQRRRQPRRRQLARRPRRRLHQQQCERQRAE